MESIPYERCQVPSCPLTGGWENINHAVKPGCIRYNQAFNYDLSSNENKSLVSTLKFPNGNNIIVVIVMVKVGHQRANPFLHLILCFQSLKETKCAVNVVKKILAKGSAPAKLRD